MDNMYNTESPDVELPDTDSETLFNFGGFHLLTSMIWTILTICYNSDADIDISFSSSSSSNDDDDNHDTDNEKMLTNMAIIGMIF